MVLQPVGVRGIGALVPSRASAPVAAPDPHTVVVRLSQSLDGHPVYRVNDQPVDPTLLAATLANIVAVHDGRTIFVQADAALDYQPVLAVVNAAHAAGMRSIGLVTPRTLPRN